MKLLRYNLPVLQLPSEVVLDIDFHAENLLEITTTENTVEYGYCLQFESEEPRPLNIACYRWPIGEWFVNPDKIDRIVATHTTISIIFKDGNQNICDCCRFC